ncbi:hypothetical protein M5689_025125 [Euphorbia peplus]|nr:hypothetical protein M5689_025125 [Euphorbia peplus]
MAIEEDWKVCGGRGTVCRFIMAAEVVGGRGRNGRGVDEGGGTSESVRLRYHVVNGTGCIHLYLYKQN